MGNSSKSSSRLFAVQILYEMELNGKSFEVIQKRFSDDSFVELEKINNQGKQNKSYIEKLVKGASKNQKKIDELINKNLKNWKLSRIESLVRAILRSLLIRLNDINIKSEDFWRSLNVMTSLSTENDD